MRRHDSVLIIDYIGRSVKEFVKAQDHFCQVFGDMGLSGAPAR